MTIASELDAIAGAGPGAFTGLRLACGVAQGLALGLENPSSPSAIWRPWPINCQVGKRSSSPLMPSVSLLRNLSAQWRGLYRTCAPSMRLAEAVRLPEEGIGPVSARPFRPYRDVLVDTLGARLDSFDCTPQPAAGAIARLAASVSGKGEAIDPVLAAPLVRDQRWP